MQDAAPPVSGERGWGRLLIALAAFLFIPVLPPFNAFLPVGETLLLLVPALAACCLVGWWSGGRFLLAAVWVGLAAFTVAQPAVPGSYYNLVRGWSLLLGGGFGLVCLLAERRPFLSRAIATLSLSLVFAVLLGVKGPLTPSRVRSAVQTELARRNAESGVRFRAAVQQYPEMLKAHPELSRAVGEGGSVPDAVDQSLKATAEAGAGLFPSLLLLESLIALALAWATYHRLARTRIGAPLGRLKDFRFNDQLVWGLIVGLTIVFVPALEFLGGTGRNLLVFFGTLYAIRGFGVLSWFLAPGALALMLGVGFAMLVLPVLRTVTVAGFILLSLAAFGLGLGDTWADWRRRTRTTT